MNKNFATRICPLCSKKLNVGDEDSVYTYYCSEFYLKYPPNGLSWWLSFSKSEFVGAKVKEPHYSVDINNGIWKQSTIIPPYWIISSSDSNKSRIYKFNKEIVEPSEKDLLMEVPIIIPSDYVPEDFARRIKKLVIFT